MYFESHHTFDLTKESREALKQILPDCGGKYSEIDGDPLLGEKVYAYATFHADTLDSMKIKWLKFENLLTFYELFWIRRKIEHIIIDERREK